MNAASKPEPVPFFLSVGFTFHLLQKATDEQLADLKITREDLDTFMSRPSTFREKHLEPGTIATFSRTESREQNTNCIYYDPDKITYMITEDMNTVAHEVRHGIELWKKEKEKPAEEKKEKSFLKIFCTAMLGLALSVDLLEKPLSYILKQYVGFKYNRQNYDEEVLCFEFAERFNPYNLVSYYNKVDTEENFLQNMISIYGKGYPTMKKRNGIEKAVHEERNEKTHPLYPEGFNASYLEYLYQAEEYFSKNVISLPVPVVV